MNKNQSTIEPERIIDKDVYDLMAALQSCKKKYTDIINRYKKDVYSGHDAVDIDYEVCINDAMLIVSGLAQDKLLYDMKGGQNENE